MGILCNFTLFICGRVGSINGGSGNVMLMLRILVMVVGVMVMAMSVVCGI